MRLTLGNGTLLAALIIPVFCRSGPSSLPRGHPLEGYAQLRLDGLDVYLPPNRARHGEGVVRRRCESALERVGEALRRAPKGRISIVLAGTREDFRRFYRVFAGREPRRSTRAAAVSRRRLILVDDREDILVPFLAGEDPVVVLAHEITHVVVEEVVAQDVSVPLWFQEGVAMWASGWVMFPGDQVRLESLARAGALIPLDDLDREMPAEHDLERTAYLQGGDLVRFMEERGGAGTVARILARMEEGTPFPDAVAPEVGAGLEDLESDWQAALRRRFSYLRWFLTVLHPFTATSVLLVFAYVLYRVRRRRWMQAQDTERDAEV